MLIRADNFQRFFLSFFIDEHVCVVALLGSAHIATTNFLVVHYCASSGRRLVVIAIAVLIFTESLELHLRKIEARDYRIVKLEPGLPVCLEPLFPILTARISLSFNVDVGNVVSSISNTHVNDDADKFVIKFFRVQFFSVSYEVLQVLVFFFTSVAINLGFLIVLRLLLCGRSFIFIELCVFVLVASLHTLCLGRVT